MEQGLRSPPPMHSRAGLFLLDASHSPDSGIFLVWMLNERRSPVFSRTQIVDSSTTSWSEMRSRVSSSQIFHYMGHGRRDGSGTTLVLNAKESLRAEGIDPKLFQNSQLAVLAACSTGIGRENGLLDTHSLVRAFLLARVPRVIASHWDVDSETTSRLMISFYQNLNIDKSVALAIYHARNAISADRPHPYYWASFSLTGRVS